MNEKSTLTVFKSFEKNCTRYRWTIHGQAIELIFKNRDFSEIHAKHTIKDIIEGIWPDYTVPHFNIETIAVIRPHDDALTNSENE
jgi:hypothetical protein